MGIDKSHKTHSLAPPLYSFTIGASHKIPLPIEIKMAKKIHNFKVNYG